MSGIGLNGYPLCARGHERTPENVNPKNGKCRACVSEYNREWAKNNVERNRVRKAKYAEDNADSLRAKRQEKYWADPEKFRSKTMESAKKHPERVKARLDRWRKDNACHVKAYQAQYMKDNAEKVRMLKAAHYQKNKERLGARWAKYYAENFQHLREKRIKYYWNNVETERCKSAKYAKENPILCRLARHKRRARIKANGGELSKDITVKLLLFQKGRCRICKIKLVGVKYHLDHIVPIAKGGLNVDGNIQLLCQKCNQSKGSKDPHLYARQLGMLFL